MPPPRSPDTRDSLGQYLEEIGRYELLTAEQEVELAKLMETGLQAESELDDSVGQLNEEQMRGLEEMAQAGREAKATFISSNLRLVVSIAKNYQRVAENSDFRDLIQMGNLGLIRAVEKFDWRRGFKFSTYATWWIRQSIGRGVSDTDRMIRIPVHKTDSLLKIKDIQNDLWKRNGIRPSVREIAEKSGVPEEEVADLLDIRATIGSLASLDLVIGDEPDGMTLADTISDASVDVEEQAIVNLDIAGVVGSIDQILSDRESFIVRARMGFLGRRYTLDELGEHYGFTRERVRQIEAKALAKLRKKAPDLELTG